MDNLSRKNRSKKFSLNFSVARKTGGIFCTKTFESIRHSMSIKAELSNCQIVCCEIQTTKILRSMCISREEAATKTFELKTSKSLKSFRIKYLRYHQNILSSSINE